MTQQYKILSAMLALREFTIRDLSRYSDVKPTTVSTTLGRDRQYVEQIGKNETKKRGGQWVRWRVKPDQFQNLKSRVSGLFNDMRAIPGVLDETDSAPEVPTALRVAEDILVRLYPEAESPEKRRELLELAELNFNAAKGECENFVFGDDYTSSVEAIQRKVQSVGELLECHNPREVMQTHIIFCESLINLSEMEYDLFRNRDPKHGAVEVLHTQLTVSCGQLWDLGGNNRQVAFHTMQRVANSPLISRALRY